MSAHRLARPRTAPPHLLASAAARAAALAILLSGAILLAPPASADVGPAPEPPGYAPPPPPTLDLTVLEPICDGDVPYLRYAVDVTGTEASSVTITWIDPGGDDVVQAGLPMSGRVLWPGAVVGPAGEPLDWPGWRLEGDTWVEGDEFDWVRPSVDVLFQVNPEATVTVAYPPSSPDCATNPPGAPAGNPPSGATSTPAAGAPGGAGAGLPGARAAQPGSAPVVPGSSWLPTTGAQVAGTVIGAAVLLALGTAVVVLARRRRA
ncbi:peptidase [Xylanimonas oleitrophica]|uniref:Peptidase n=1 Tax=Xylanimonas oleitrophica TaxID=2607479 RepID=A0A2W5WJF2_9MICO|nr:LPXTG cell wall anchor domain-containing protein [Xylanimonas oleitrophica]PZR51649.1 peptidase [Xylanimonas oleitrophica]